MLCFAGGVQTVSTMNELVEVKELRERYRYNINPWVSHMAKRGLRLFYTESDVEETDSDDDADGKSTTVATSNGGKDGSKTKSKFRENKSFASDDDANVSF